ncbi:uncharacterized protein K12H4.2 [Diabrotica virgifera virgifera]|uniref:Mitochondrial assembly of ribosomal large subunit protein 1 n=1 Tax=Diabrotica virgifera virgifera TaxID=50390 RepID=A0A6P7GPL9_DIAVI|nr:uncharacterized protein K12H4.2 [Diabrotica virgifera virgifera]
MISNFRYILAISKPKFVKIYRPLVSTVRFKSNQDASNADKKTTTKPKAVLGNMSSKYDVFSDADAEIILDVYEEKLKYSQLLEEEEQEVDRYVGLNLERGKTGVYDIEDLVEVLKREQAQNIFVVSVPKEINYVDYICIVNGKSVRHMQAIAQFIKKVFKQKRRESDLLPKVEGEDSRDWLALDLGNIALHIFSEKARAHYNLESLWALGHEFDDEYNRPEPVSDILEKHSVYLKDLQPAS